jgi:hypothetical protein
MKCAISIFVRMWIYFVARNTGYLKSIVRVVKFANVFILDNKQRELEIDDLKNDNVDFQTLRSYLDQKGNSGTQIDNALCLTLSMKDSTDYSLIIAQSPLRLPPIKKLQINYIPASGDSYLSTFLSNSIPRHIQFLQF